METAQQNKYLKYWPHVVGAALLILILLFIFRKVPLPGNDPLYDHLQHQKDSLLRQEKIKEERLRKADIKIDSLTSVISNNDEKIKKIYINVERRIMVYDTFTVEQLENFFSERFGTGRKD